MPTSSSYHDENPPCIVGMACRLPGGISSPSGLWEFLMRNKSAQGPVPIQRFNKDGFYHPDGSNGVRAGAMEVAGGYFLNEDVRNFDNAFFGIHNLEAASMDPQQRKLLEIVFECLEHAGASLDQMSGSNTGVYVGNFTLDHQTMQSRDIDAIHRFSATGCGTTILANRISHVFNLQGPSFTLDTACSSSLYALHSAVSALQEGDCEAAVVAAVNLIMSPEQCLAAGKSGVLSPTSTCHTFDVAADGYGRAEGMNAIYIKPLSSAMRDGDKIWAVIRSTAVNANGKTPGITQPSADLQEAVIRRAYSKAGLGFADTDYIECHGTGTPVGDPIEVEALGRCFGDSDRKNPLLIGSSKPGLGHSEAASGLTALIKVALALDKAKIPPTHGLKTVNPKLKLDKFNMKVAMEIESWPRELRRASINAFGYGGANAHCILESARSYTGPKYQNNSRPMYDYTDDRLFILPISAASPTSLKSRIYQIQKLVSTSDVATFENLTYTLAERTSHLSARDVLLAKCDKQDGKPRLLSLDIASEIIQDTGGDLATTFVFTGQGAQYANMAKELLLRNKHFRESIRRLDCILHNLAPEHAPIWTLESTILDPLESEQIHHASRSQPVCTAIQMGLVDLLQRWHITPRAVVGHSSGEIAAAYAAGLLSAPEAILTAYFRGYAVQKLARKGSMMAVGMRADMADMMIRQNHLENEVSVACINSAENVTLSGTTGGIDHLMGELQKQGHFARRLHTGNKAYHSYMMKEAGELYEALLAPYLDVASQSIEDGESPAAKMYSSVQTLNDNESSALDRASVSASYWRSNLQSPVQFRLALSTLLNKHTKMHLVEVGPHAALKGPVKQICSELKRDQISTPYSSTLTRNQDSDLCMKRLAAVLFLRHHPLAWQNINHLTTSTLVSDIPPYPWDYSSGLNWQEPRASIELRNRRYLRHELLGAQQIASNGVNWLWRNVLNLGEIPWVRDHKLESQVVFPAAGYLAMAIEAVSQVRGHAGETPSFQLRYVDISTALVIPEDESKDRVEIHTILSPQALSRTNVSRYWYDFSISSLTAGGQATVHCSGSIRITDDSECTIDADTVTVSQTNGFEEWSNMNVWYNKFARDGLILGPNFRSVAKLNTDGARSCYEAKGNVRIVPAVAERINDTRYLIHPITIDACIQTAIMGSAGGDVSETCVYLPVFIDKCCIRIAAQRDCQAQGLIQAVSAKTSPSTCRMASTLWSTDPTPVPLVNMRGVRVIQYKTTISRDLLVPRQPCLQVCWKPDIRHIHSGNTQQLDKYVTKFIAKCQDDDTELSDNERLAAIAALVDLAGHKNPRMRVLDLGNNCSCRVNMLLDILGNGTGFRRCKSWLTGKVNEDGAIQLQGGSEGVNDSVAAGPFDLLYVHKSPRVWDAVDQLHSLVAADGVIITQNTPVALEALQRSRFSVTEIYKNSLILASQSSRETNGVGTRRSVFLVVHNPSAAVTSFTKALAACLNEKASCMDFQIISLYEIGNIKLSRDNICVLLLELENELLASMDQCAMDHLRGITNTVTTILWLSGANLLSNESHPDLSLSSGLSRALMLEHPSLAFIVMDVGQIASQGNSEIQNTCYNIIRVLDSCDKSSKQDGEFVQRDGLLYISRFGPSFDMNLLFRRRMEKQEAVMKTKLSVSRPARLAIGTFGGSDTLHFEQVRECMSAVPNDFIDVLVKAVSLNAKDVYALKGKVETRRGTTALEFSGVVTAVGANVTHLQPGDDVVVGMPCHLATSQRVPVWAAFKMNPGEQYTVMATFPTIYGTALYALSQRASLRPGESILIHGGAGAFGFAAITIAKNILGTTSGIYTTAGSEARRKFIATECGIPEANIFYSRDASFATNIKSATKGRGVNVVINFLTGDLLQASWECIAPFGRFVEIGKRDLLDAGRLDMRAFLQNTTFTAFDFSDLYYQQMQYQDTTFSQLLTEVIKQYRSGLIKPPPITTFTAANVVEAYRFFSSQDRVGKIVVSFEREDSEIPLAPSKYLTLFDPDKVYLLVGCLGGLGRSLSRWMVARGARKFVFLGRSGCDKPSARELVFRLRDVGASVDVVRGDIVNRADADAAVAACTRTGSPLGGVIQAAMGLHEALFANMSADGWQTSIQPKWKGTWNLHHAIEGYEQNLDFFLLTSSLSGTIGTATESNYCAANGFLDAFAHWRRSQGKPAVSVGLGMISEVGYLHEHSDIEALLLRKGIQPLNEAEFLQVIDLALTQVGGVSNGGENSEDPAASHILTGLEPLGFRQLARQGFDVGFSSAHDPRLAILAAALEAEQDIEKGRFGTDSEGRDGPIPVAEWFQSVPTHAKGPLASQASAESLQIAMLRLILNRFSSLILTPIDQINTGKPLARFGVDSMIASEFRTWFWTALKIDVPFLDILSADKTLITLAEFAVVKLLEG